MSDRFLVEFDRRAVGVALRVGGGFRFFASDPGFMPLEDRVFPRVRGLMRQVAQSGRAMQRRQPVPGPGLQAQAC